MWKSEFHLLAPHHMLKCNACVPKLALGSRVVQSQTHTLLMDKTEHLSSAQALHIYYIYTFSPQKYLFGHQIHFTQRKQTPLPNEELTLNFPNVVHWVWFTLLWSVCQGISMPDTLSDSPQTFPCAGEAASFLGLPKALPDFFWQGCSSSVFPLGGSAEGCCLPLAHHVPCIVKRSHLDHHSRSKSSSETSRTNSLPPRAWVALGLAHSKHWHLVAAARITPPPARGLGGERKRSYFFKASSICMNGCPVEGWSNLWRRPSALSTALQAPRGTGFILLKGNLSQFSKFLMQIWYELLTQTPPKGRNSTDSTGGWSSCLLKTGCWNLDDAAVCPRSVLKQSQVIWLTSYHQYKVILLTQI